MEVFCYGPAKFSDAQRGAILGALSHVEHAEQLLSSIADACGLYGALCPPSAQAVAFPPARETVQKLARVNKLLGLLISELEGLNLDAYYEFKLHAGSPDLRAGYPLNVRAAIGVLKWLRQVAEKGEARYATQVHSGRPTDEAARVLAEQLMTLYPGEILAEDASPFLARSGKPRPRFQAFVAAVFDVCGCGVHPDVAIAELLERRRSRETEPDSSLSKMDDGAAKQIELLSSPSC